jgi:small GTP-binding protein
MKTINIIGKICLLGDGQVGKTSLIRKFVVDQFSDSYITTVGTKVSKKKLLLPFPEQDMEFDLTMTIWDILGQKEFMSLHSTFYAGAIGGLAVCDLTRHDTWESLPKWIESLHQVTGPIPIVILGNKCDLKPEWQVTETEMDKVARQFKTIFMYTSARTGENVELAFQNLASDIIEEKYLKAAANKT